MKIMLFGVLTCCIFLMMKDIIGKKLSFEIAFLSISFIEIVKGHEGNLTAFPLCQSFF